MLTITDDYSRKTWVYPTRARSDASAIFKRWQLQVEAESTAKVLAIRCDNAPELKALYEHITDNGGIMELSAPYTLQQNGVAERINRTIIEKSKTMLFDSGLLKNLWPEIVQTAAYLRNRILTKGEDRTPEERWSDKRPDLAHLKVFECIAYALINKNLQDKLEQNSRKTIFIGYGKTASHYRLWDPETRRVVIATDVAFDEGSIGTVSLEPMSTEESLEEEPKKSTD
jgi:hypothetical protein